KSLFSDEQLGQALINKVKEGSSLELADFLERILVLQKVSGLSARLHITEDIALRVIQGEKPLEEAIAEHREQGRGPSFLAQLINSEHMLKHGLSSELMEWI